MAGGRREGGRQGANTREVSEGLKLGLAVLQGGEEEVSDGAMEAWTHTMLLGSVLVTSDKSILQHSIAGQSGLNSNPPLGFSSPWLFPLCWFSRFHILPGIKEPTLPSVCMGSLGITGIVFPLCPARTIGGVFHKKGSV